MYTVSQDGALFQWHYAPLSNQSQLENDAVDDATPMGWRIAQRHYFMQSNAKILCAAYHASSNLLVAGFSNGLFGLYELPDFNMIHTLRFVVPVSINPRSNPTKFIIASRSKE